MARLRLNGDPRDVLSDPQRSVLIQVEEQEHVRGLPAQTVASMVVRGFVVPGSPMSLTREGRSAARSGVSRQVARVGGLVWCEVASLDTWVLGDAATMTPESWEGMWSLRKLPVWAVYGPAGPHLLYRGQGCWWLRCSGVRDREAVQVRGKGARGAMAYAGEVLLERRVPVFEEARKPTTQ